MGVLGPSRIDRAALSELLQLAGLFDHDLSVQVARLAGGFPVAVRRDLFVEFELGERRIPSGFGVGFADGLYDRYLANDHWFPESSTGRAIEDARSQDPFASDHAVYLNVLGDDDPDWIEYDIANGRIDLTPFVFFRPPSRFQLISTSEQAQRLCELLPDAAPGGEFAALLEVLIRLGPAGMYRVGRASQRGAGWWRVIISQLRDGQVVAALRSRGAIGFEKPLELARMFYADRADVPGAIFALSVDVQDGRISAMDVECPYFLRVGDMALRNVAFEELIAQSARSGILSAASADWLASNGCCRDVVATAARGAMRVRAHHMKYRFLGAPHLRTKFYLHLEMTDPRASGASA